MAKRSVLPVHFAGDPDGHWTPIDVSTIRYAILWRAVERAHVIAPWAARVPLSSPERARVIVSTADGRVAVTEHTTIASFLAAVGDPAFVHANHSVVVNVLRVDKYLRPEGWLLYHPRDKGHPEQREAIELSRTGRRLVWAALGGRRPLAGNEAGPSDAGAGPSGDGEPST
jgi:hypothetical protein